ncbi:UNVERIFIED_CONTAM: hypothetical protein ABIC26_000445 [Paenibacillus sp. PvR008]
MSELSYRSSLVLPTPFNSGDPVEYFFDNETGVVTLQKSNGVFCKMCGSIEELTYFKKSFLCKECIVELKGEIKE